MRVDTLYRRMSADVKVLQDALRDVLPVSMPKRYETRDMNIRRFVKKLNTITEPHGVFNEIVDDLTLKEGTEVATAGLWLPKDDLPENGSDADVRVLWHMHPKTKRFPMSPYHWNRRRFYFYQLLMHELIHRHQGQTERIYRVRSQDRTTKEDQKYYGSTTEIEAHAHDAAMELHTWYPGVPFAQALTSAKQVFGPTPSTYVLYAETFEECPSHPAFRHFKRKLRAWYDFMQKRTDFYHELHLPSLVQCRL